MKIFRLAQDNKTNTNDANDHEFVLKAGTILYHGTIEEFDYKKPKASIDGVFWTTEYKNIAASYIPMSGGRLFTSVKYIVEPTQDQAILSLQKKLGINYDMSKVEFDGQRAKSYPYPEVFEDPYYWDYKKGGDSNNRCRYIVEKLKDVLGYEPINASSKHDPCYAQFELKVDGNDVMPSDYRAEGRLLEVSPTRDMLIYDITLKGKRDGDFMEADYRKYDLFKNVSGSKYDGIKINDFHTTKRMGLFGHTAIGFFSKSLADLSVVDYSATHPEGSLY